VTKIGDSLYLFTGANTYSGPTTLCAGVLRANSGAGLSAASNLVLAGGILESAGTGTFTRGLGTGGNQVRWTDSGGLAATGGKLTIALGGTASPTPLTWGAGGFVPAGSALLLGSATTDSEIEFRNSINLAGAARTIFVIDNPFSGADFATLSGTLPNGAFTKDGPGMMLLKGYHPCTGATTVAAGTLKLAAAAGLASLTLDVRQGATLDLRDVGAYILGAGRTLCGTGSVLGYIAAGGTVAPGPGPGVLSVGSLYLTSGSRLDMELGGTARGSGYDVLALSGGLSLDAASTLAVALTGNFVPLAGDAFDILDFAGLTGQFGTINLPALPAGLSWATDDLYRNGTIRVIPEPATLSLLAPALLLRLTRGFPRRLARGS